MTEITGGGGKNGQKMRQLKQEAFKRVRKRKEIWKTSGGGETRRTEDRTER